MNTAQSDQVAASEARRAHDREVCKVLLEASRFETKAQANLERSEYWAAEDAPDLSAYFKVDSEVMFGDARRAREKALKMMQEYPDA